MLFGVFPGFMGLASDPFTGPEACMPTSLKFTEKSFYSHEASFSHTQSYSMRRILHQSFIFSICGFLILPRPPSVLEG